MAPVATSSISTGPSRTVSSTKRTVRRAIRVPSRESTGPPPPLVRVVTGRSDARSRRVVVTVFWLSGSGRQRPWSARDAPAASIVLLGKVDSQPPPGGPDAATLCRLIAPTSPRSAMSIRTAPGDSGNGWSTRPPALGDGRKSDRGSGAPRCRSRGPTRGPGRRRRLRPPAAHPRRTGHSPGA